MGVGRRDRTTLPMIHSFPVLELSLVITQEQIFLSLFTTSFARCAICGTKSKVYKCYKNFNHNASFMLISELEIVAVTI